MAPWRATGVTNHLRGRVEAEEPDHAQQGHEQPYEEPFEEALDREEHHGVILPATPSVARFGSRSSPPRPMEGYKRREETRMAEANKDMVQDANKAEEAKAQPRPGDAHAYEDSWYQVLKARQAAAEDAEDSSTED